MDQLPLSHEKDIIIPLPEGIANTKKWVISRDNQRLFLKETFVKQNSLTRQELNKIKSKFNFFVPVLEEKFVKDKNYTLSPFIKGKKFNNHTLFQTQTIADKVGKMLACLAKCNVDSDEIKLSDIKQNFLADIEFFFACRKAHFDFTKEEFIKEGLFLLKSFEGQSQHLIHGDIKPDNIIISKDKIYFVDIDEMKKGFFAFNFQFTCQMLFYRSKKYSEFFRRVILAFFDGNVPDWFVENYKFMLYNKFFNRARIFIEKGDIEGERLFYKEFKHIFKLIRKKDWKIF